MRADISQVKFKNRIVLLVQSYPAFRLLYYLIENGYNVIVLTSNPNVKNVCQSLRIANILIRYEMSQTKLNYLIPNFAIRNIEKLLTSVVSRAVLRRLTKCRNIDFLITIVGMDRDVLPAFFKLNVLFYYWDDSFYAKRWKSTKPNYTAKIKNYIQNLIYSTRFSLFSEENMVDFPWMEEKYLPKNCCKLLGEIDFTPSTLLMGPEFTENQWDIVFIGDYDFFEMSTRCNIAKLIRLINNLQVIYSNRVFYKAHPGSTSQSHKTIFTTEEIDSFIPIELIGNSCKIILTLGSAAVVSLKETTAKVIGIGNLVDMCEDLFPMSELQCVTHVEDFGALKSMIDDCYK